jgi:hypothetical protein
MRALSIRQPFAELILRGIKTVEYRSRTVGAKIIGTRFHIYAAKKPVVLAGMPSAGIWSNDLAVTQPGAWMVELWEQVRMIEGAVRAGLPTGVIVGSAVIESVSQIDEKTFGWNIADVRRAKTLRKPTGHPQPVWFRAF